MIIHSVLSNSIFNNTIFFLYHWWKIYLFEDYLHEMEQERWKKKGLEMCFTSIIIQWVINDVLLMYYQHIVGHRLSTRAPSLFIRLYGGTADAGRIQLTLADIGAESMFCCIVMVVVYLQSAICNMHTEFIVFSTYYIILNSCAGYEQWTAR